MNNAVILSMIYISNKLVKTDVENLWQVWVKKQKSII